jgi:hypothetical protein
MARYNVPDIGAPGSQPQPILNDIGKPQTVWLYNPGSSPVNVSDNPTQLQTKDAAGEPNDGGILAPGESVVIRGVVGGLWAMNVGGGIINCIGWPVC